MAKPQSLEERAAPVPEWNSIPELVEMDFGEKVSRAAELKSLMDRAEEELKDLKMEIAAELNVVGANSVWGYGYRFTWTEGGATKGKLNIEKLIKAGVAAATIDAARDPDGMRAPSLSMTRIKE